MQCGGQVIKSAVAETDMYIFILHYDTIVYKLDQVGIQIRKSK